MTDVEWARCDVRLWPERRTMVIKGNKVGGERLPLCGHEVLVQIAWADARRIVAEGRMATKTITKTLYTELTVELDDDKEVEGQWP